MARTRTLAQLRADVRQRADVESEDERHPDSDVDRYVNQGKAELRDLMIEVRGRSYFRSSPPQTITTVRGQTKYDLEADFLRLISIRRDGVMGRTLDPFTPQQEPALRFPNGGGGAFYPSHYELQPGTIELLPSPAAGLVFIVDYIPASPDLVADDDLLDGYDGWEEFVVVVAARAIATKDQEWDLLHVLDADKKALTTRIQKLAPNRDAFRAETIKDVRQTRFRHRWR